MADEDDDDEEENEEKTPAMQTVRKVVNPNFAGKILLSCVPFLLGPISTNLPYAFDVLIPRQSYMAYNDS